MADGLRYYDLEKYLFDDLQPRFERGEPISAFDFFCIVIWKANRAKSKVAARMLQHPSNPETLEAAVGILIGEVRNAPSHKERLRGLMKEWGFRLPMATSILSVFYPDEFTVYDYRVCEQLGRFKNLGDVSLSKFDHVWREYRAYLEAVRSEASAGLSLRDADRALWGRSFHDQLHNDIARGFQPPAKKT